MSFTITKSTEVTQQYLGLGVAVSGSTQSVELTYIIKRVTSFDGKMVTAEFTQSINGVDLSEPFRFIFKYSGEGNPMDQGESALQDYLTKVDTTNTTSSDGEG